MNDNLSVRDNSYDENIRLDTGVAILCIGFVLAVCIIILLVVGIVKIRSGCWYDKEYAIGMFLLMLVLVTPFFIFYLLDKRVMDWLDATTAPWIITAAVIAGAALIGFGPYRDSYIVANTVAFSSEVRDVFVGKNEHMYAVVTDGAGGEAWLLISSTDPKVMVGDKITGTYVRGVVRNNDGEFYQGNVTIEDVASN